MFFDIMKQPMREITAKIKPAGGFSHLLHILLTALLPALLFVLVRLGFVQLAAALIVLSKWRMFAVKPRHWPANIRANAIDIIVGLSTLIFMIHSSSQFMQLLWAVIYGAWLLLLKPQTSVLGISLQAFAGQSLGLAALYLEWGAESRLILIIVSWFICYAAARHFFANFEEAMTRYLAYAWSYVAAAMAWVLSHWLLFYGPLAQPALLLSVLGFGLGGVYYLEKTDRMSVLLRRQMIFVMVAVVIIVLTFSDWGDKTI